MKKLLGLLVALIFIVVSGSALAQGDTVSAVGSGSVTLVPDMATFSVGITTQDALIAAAQSANAAAMQAVIDALTTLGVAREDIQTEYYSVYPVYDYEYGSSYDNIKGYEVSNTVTVVVRTLASMPSLLDAAVEAGANNVYSLNFLSSEQNAAYDQALKAAVQDALRKAALIAEAVGREAGAVLSISENGSANTIYTEAFDRALSSSIATPIENGTITVTAEVTAVVEMK